MPKWVKAVGVRIKLEGSQVRYTGEIGKYPYDGNLFLHSREEYFAELVELPGKDSPWALFKLTTLDGEKMQRDEGGNMLESYMCKLLGYDDGCPDNGNYEFNDEGCARATA